MITFSSTIFSCTLFNNESINQINSDELVEFVELNDAILLDVRTKDEFNSGYIENSLNIDYFSDEFSINVDKLDKNIPIILYCRSGRRSGLSANKIKKLGFKEIYNLEGGVLEWIEQGNVIIFNDSIN
tara:strand:- start:399 stop:782 length:384 start_codon:yes stop_codon:yes gene_type:complete